MSRLAEVQRLVQERWAAQGECRSCGWRASLSEYDTITEDDIDRARGVVRLPCLSGESGHRGVRIDVREAAVSEPMFSPGEAQEWFDAEIRRDPAAALDRVRALFGDRLPHGACRALGIAAEALRVEAT